jgi:subtilisin
MEKRYNLLVLCAIIGLITCSEQNPTVSSSAALAFQSLSKPKTLQISGRYIIQFNKNTIDPSSRALNLSKKYAFILDYIYVHALKGFSCNLPDDLVPLLRNELSIESVEPDILMHAFGQIIPTGIDRIDADLIPAPVSVTDVDIVILDTGIDPIHPDLNVMGGIRFYSECIGNFCRSYSDGNFKDDNGHGTHVSGIAAAKDNGIGVVGIAPGARLWAVKVLDAGGSGYLSDIIAGIDYVTAHADVVEVLNMSLGGVGKVNAFRTAIQNCIAAGVVITVAAGNESQDVYGLDGVYGTADDVIPASYPEVAAISAFCDMDGIPGGRDPASSYGADDAFASFSNFSTSAMPDAPVTSPGKAIDLCLPGVDILSTIPGGKYAKASGTSMAAPHAAGLVARYIAAKGRATNAASVYTIRQALIDGAASQEGFQGLINGGDPDNNREPIGWAGNAEIPLTDLSINQFIGPDSVRSGEILIMTISIQNRGTVDILSDFNITINETISGKIIFRKTVSGGIVVGKALSGKAAIAVPATTSPGTYQLNVRHNLADDAVYNNQRSIAVGVKK